LDLGVRLPYIMRPAPLSFRHEVALLDEFLQAQLYGAGFALRELDDLAERDGFVIGEEGDDLLGEGVLSLHEGAEEEDEPGFPVGLLNMPST
jgi:hypothetical protein